MHTRLTRASGVALSVIILLITGCATSNTMLRAHSHFLNGDNITAIEVLESSEDIARKDQLLYWLEMGMYQHYAGQYADSNSALLKAAQYIDSTDYLSVSNEAKSLLANEWVEHYRGEYSEQLWVHSVLMMNFLLLEQYESAAVEARKSIEIIAQRPDVLTTDHFTRALVAVSFEAAGQTNDAYIVNKKLAESSGVFPLQRLVKTQAVSLGFSKADYSKANIQQHAIVFIPEGRIPAKQSGSLLTDDLSRISFPNYIIPVSDPKAPLVQINHQPCDCLTISSDFGQIVSTSLSTRGASLVAKAIFRAGVKEAIAESVEDADEILGGLTRVLLFALEEADTRSWRSLPRHYSIMRVPVPAGATELQITHGGIDHLLELPASRQPLLFYTLPRT